jgi:hypothetical protein
MDVGAAAHEEPNDGGAVVQSCGGERLHAVLATRALRSSGGHTHARHSAHRTHHGGEVHPCAQGQQLRHHVDMAVLRGAEERRVPLLQQRAEGRVSCATVLAGAPASTWS